MSKDKIHGALPDPSEKELTVKTMFDRIAPRYDIMNRLITFGLDVIWRRKTVEELKPPPGGRILDVACGTGDLCRTLLAAETKPIGLDLSRGMLASFNSKTPLINGDALKMPFMDSSLDGVTCGFALRNFTDIRPFLQEVSRILKSGSRLAILEVDKPKNVFIRLGHSLYFNKVVPVIGKIFSDKEAYQYLPRSTVYLPSENELIEMIKTEGFADVTKMKLTGGIAQLLIARKEN